MSKAVPVSFQLDGLTPGDGQEVVAAFSRAGVDTFEPTVHPFLKTLMERKKDLRGRLDTTFHLSQTCNYRCPAPRNHQPLREVSRSERASHGTDQSASERFGGVRTHTAAVRKARWTD